MNAASIADRNTDSNSFVTGSGQERRYWFNYDVSARILLLYNRCDVTLAPHIPSKFIPHARGATISKQPSHQHMGELKYRQRTTHTMREARSILIINPNSTESMTDGLKPLVDSLKFKDVDQHLSPVAIHLAH